MKQLKISQQITNRDSATVEKYFNEISKERLLTQEEEIELAKRIRQGDKQALEKLVKSNLRFVVSVAKQYHHGSLPLNDLINEGNVGLIKAAQMFDETKGFKFISYAVWWIRQSIMKALDDHSRIVRVPSNKLGTLYKISQATSAIEQRQEREPTKEELAEYLGLQVEDIQNATTASVRQSSLDAPFGQDNEGSLLDVMMNPDAEIADTSLVNKASLTTEIDRILATLSDREKDVIKRFFGIGYSHSMSMEDIADALSLSTERVRQIKETALKKMRSTQGSKLLISYLN